MPLSDDKLRGLARNKDASLLAVAAWVGVSAVSLYAGYLRELLQLME